MDDESMHVLMVSRDARQDRESRYWSENAEAGPLFRLGLKDAKDLPHRHG